MYRHKIIIAEIKKHLITLSNFMACANSGNDFETIHPELDSLFSYDDGLIIEDDKIVNIAKIVIAQYDKWNNNFTKNDDAHGYIWSIYYNEISKLIEEFDVKLGVPRFLKIEDLELYKNRLLASTTKESIDEIYNIGWVLYADFENKIPHPKSDEIVECFVDYFYANVDERTNVEKRFNNLANSVINERNSKIHF